MKRATEMIFELCSRGRRLSATAVTTLGRVYMRGPANEPGRLWADEDGRLR